MVEDQQVRVHLHGADHEVGQFPLADQEPRIHLGAALNHRVEHLHAGRAAEFPELRKRGLPVGGGPCLHAHENRAIGGLHLAGGLPLCEFPFERRDESGEIEIQFGGTLRGKDLPVTAVRVFGDEVGGAGEAGEAVLTGLDRADQIQPQQRQVREVVQGELLAA